MPHPLDAHSNSFEHAFHDVTQRVQRYWNMVELHDEARISAELMRGSQQAQGPGALNKGLKRTWLSRLLSAVIAAVSSHRYKTAGTDLRELFSHDENAYFMQLPTSGQAEPEAGISSPVRSSRLEQPLPVLALPY